MWMHYCRLHWLEDPGGPDLCFISPGKQSLPHISHLHDAPREKGSISLRIQAPNPCHHESGSARADRTEEQKMGLGSVSGWGFFLLLHHPLNYNTQKNKAATWTPLRACLAPTHTHTHTVAAATYAAWFFCYLLVPVTAVQMTSWVFCRDSGHMWHANNLCVTRHSKTTSGLSL